MQKRAVSEAGEAPGEPREVRPSGRPRRPYLPPRVESGQAFERVQLASPGCNEGVFDGCANPC